MLTRDVRLSLVVLTLVGVCGCVDRGPEPIAFTKVDLPAGSVPVVVSSSQIRELYVGVRREGKPGLLRRASDGAMTEIPVRAAGPAASWYSLDSYGDQIVGVTRGDRQSVWTGTVAGIDEQPGGAVGDLAGAVQTRRDIAVLIGTDVAAWTGAGDDWTRHPSAESGVAAAATEHAGGRVLVAGWQRSETGSVPVVWHFDTEPAQWVTQRLPDAGRTGTALAATCWLTDLCAAAGQVDGTLAVWKTTDHGWTRETGVPSIAVAEHAKPAAPVEVDDWLIQAVSDGGQVKLAVEGHDAWTVHPTTGPTGTVTAMVRAGDDFFLLAGPDENSQTLWRTDADPRRWQSIRNQG